MVKAIFKKILPSYFFDVYHKVVAYMAAFFYGLPSKKMIIIGVIGTSGKSTVVNLISCILEQAGFTVGFTTTFNFKIAGKETVNTMRMTMPGRFALQKLLRHMYKAHCEYAIIETTSQGIVQSRHRGIEYDIAVFTNLSPEHIESHGSFDKYRQAKEQLFAHITKKNNKEIFGKKIKKISILNLDDENVKHFLPYKADEKYGYGIKIPERSRGTIPSSSPDVTSGHYGAGPKPEQARYGTGKIIKAREVRLAHNRSEFLVDDMHFTVNLLGKFNIYNALAAISVSLSQGIDLSVCQRALEKIKSVPGRMEVVHKHPLVIIDQAHTPDSLEKVYNTIGNNQLQGGRLICVFGAAGGGRDKWKRPVLGKIGEQYCDYIIVTNEDPYDEDPQTIINEIISGIKNKDALYSKKKLYNICDRKYAIKKALEIAQKNDIIIITGKGAEQSIVVKNKKILWSDKKIVHDYV